MASFFKLMICLGDLGIARKPKIRKCTKKNVYFSNTIIGFHL